MDNSIAYWLIYRGVYHYLGWLTSERIKVSCWEFYAKQPHPKRCAFCGKHIKHKDRSVDHIIPVSIINQLELPGLLFDHRNMRLAHQQCNSKRGDKIHDLPKSVVAKLSELGYNPS